MFPYRYIFQKSILLIVQYKYLKSCSGDFILQNPILRTRSCGTGFITQSSWGFHFRQTTLVWWKCFVPQLYQFRRGISGGPALKYFHMIHRGERTYIHVYIHIYVYIYTCIHIYKRTYIYIHALQISQVTTHKHTYTYTCIHTYIHAYINTYIHFQTCASDITGHNKHTYTDTYIFTYIHTYIHAYIYTNMHTYIRIHVFWTLQVIWGGCN